VVFVLDTSGSIGNFRFQLFRDFVSGIATTLDIGLQESLVGVILFSTEASIQFSLVEHTDEASLLSAIDPGIPYKRGRTNTAEALRLLLSSARDGTMGLRNGRPHIAIVVTDGESNNRNATITAASKLHADGSFNQVYAVGVGGANLTELRVIASDPSLVRSTSSFDASAVQALQYNITEQLCTDQRKYIMLYLQLFSTLV